jgi:hypothetical protein
MMHAFEVYEVRDKEFQRMMEEVLDDGPNYDPDRDTEYYVREKGRPVCRVEPSYTIIVNDER